MSRIDLNKNYKTQSGLSVILYSINNQKDYIHGVVRELDGTDKLLKWDSKGIAFSSDMNLVEYNDFKFSMNLKKIDYFGIQLYVNPNKAWIATDKDGSVYAYDGSMVPVVAISDWDGGDGHAVFYELEYTGDWKTSLMEIV
jgi:hypothetical protein